MKKISQASTTISADSPGSASPTAKVSKKHTHLFLPFATLCILCVSTGSRKAIAQGGVSPRTSCIRSSWGVDPKNRIYGEVLILENRCDEPLRVQWAVGRAPDESKTIPALGLIFTADTWHEDRDHEVSVYACPMDYPIPTQPSGVDVSGHVREYHCTKRTY